LSQVRRFQRILEVSGINSSLKAKGIAEGDTVVLGETEFEWNDDQSETAMYGAWLDHMKNSGKGRIGSARWPSKGW
jgi:GTP-binding protein